jgi:hypothetical protein
VLREQLHLTRAVDQQVTVACSASKQSVLRVSGQ